MKNLSLKTFIFSFFIFLVFSGCTEDKNSNGMSKVHWDRDICERCKMIVSERKFAVQIINPETKQSYMFDDLGCAVVWFIEKDLTWFNEARIFITDATTGEWVNAREAVYIDDTMTPMNYGLSAYSKETVFENQSKLNFEQAVKKIIEVDNFQKSKQ